MASRLGVGAAAATAMMLAAGMVQADTPTIASSGGWDLFGGTTSDNTPVCGISKDLEGRYFSVKMFSGRSTFTSSSRTRIGVL